MTTIRRKSEGLIARVNFPLYTIQILDSRHVLVGGGGGSSNTGVTNGFEIYEISHNGYRFVAEEVSRHGTGPCAVMNCSSVSVGKHSYIVITLDNYAQLYTVQSTIFDDDIKTIGEEHVRQRKSTSKKDAETFKRLKLVLNPADTVKMHFEGDDPLLRVVRINRQGNLMASGGTEGFVKMWKFPSLQFVGTLKGHKKEIDDIDFSPFENQLISVAKDGVAIIWDYVGGKELNRLKWPLPDGAPKYLYKRCRFGIVENEKERCDIYTLVNPVAQSKIHKSYLQKWSSEGKLKLVNAVNENLSALAVGDDGRFVAVGTMFTGSVMVFAAFSLQRIFTVHRAHSMFITGLEFLPVATNNHPIVSVAEFAVLSISVDNQVRIHSLPFRKKIPIWMGICIIIVLLFFTFVFCTYLGI